MPKKVKRPAKKVDQVEELDSVFERTRRGFVENWRLFTIGFVVVGFIVVAVLLWMRNLEQKEKRASFLLSQGMNRLTEADGLTGEEANRAYDEALQTLGRLVEEYGSAESGKLGLLYRGKCLSRLKRFGEAIEQYEAFLSTNSRNDLYRSMALQSLGFAYQNTKEYEKALQCFRKVAEIDESFLRGESILAQARIYEEMRQQGQALEVYQDFLKQFPDSPELDRIERRVASIEAQAR
jgi:tetratricopeptide (TPR) repeat protein